ncbi:hypothetical protein F2Q69_00022478 [Brassica cretica]|uniref:Uncharacterized protein n=1 Tax=Brassica cretica TaxID=69181 RepID=A0A8S9QQ38_BRACR|nr:hypothetical protein F2Q69_00022478 [Brassica cretica]
MVNKASKDVTSSSQFRSRDVAADDRSVLLFSIQLAKDRLNPDPLRSAPKRDIRGEGVYGSE